MNPILFLFYLMVLVQSNGPGLRFYLISEAVGDGKPKVEDASIESQLAQCCERIITTVISGVHFAYFYPVCAHPSPERALREGCLVVLIKMNNVLRTIDLGFGEIKCQLVDTIHIHRWNKEHGPLQRKVAKW